MLQASPLGISPLGLVPKQEPCGEVQDLSLRLFLAPTPHDGAHGLGAAGAHEQGAGH
jgi:hypothetical protein